jgi:hypothetical protein
VSDDQSASESVDPVLVRRARATRLAVLGKTIGYSLLLVATVAFVAGFFVGFGLAGPVVIAALAATTVTLAPAIVVGYGVKAADREDRGLPSGH